MRSLIPFAALAAFAILVAGCAQTTTTSEGTPPQERQVAEAETAKYTYGTDTAKVHIEAFFPLNEKHTKMVEFLTLMPDKYPDKVRVTIWDFRTDEGGARCKEVFGKICGGILINGKSDFTVTIDGKPKEVSTLGGEWVSWTKPEVEAAVAQVVAETYPEPGASPEKE
jgi:hypothetical protein